MPISLGAGHRDMWLVRLVELQELLLVLVMVIVAVIVVTLIVMGFTARLVLVKRQETRQALTETRASSQVLLFSEF